MSAGHKTVCEAFPNRFLLGLGVSHGHLVAGIRKHDWSKPYSYMVEYLERMRSALFMAKGPDVDGDIVLAALRPRMLELSATAAAGAHPYLTTPAHTADARKILGPDPLLAVEQMAILSTDPEVARRIARAGLAMYIRLPNYVNNLKNYGFTDEDFADGGSDRLVDELVVWGDVDAVTARVKEHLDAGVAADALSVGSPARPGDLRSGAGRVHRLLAGRDDEVVSGRAVFPDVGIFRGRLVHGFAL